MLFFSRSLPSFIAQKKMAKFSILTHFAVVVVGCANLSVIISLSFINLTLQNLLAVIVNNYRAGRKEHVDGSLKINQAALLILH